MPSSAALLAQGVVRSLRFRRSSARLNKVTPARRKRFTALYSELRRLARRELARHGVPVRLSPTTLLHEAYLDMAAQGGPSFPDRARFMAYSARVMRGLIIDHVRSRRARKRGGQFEITSLENEADEQVIDERELTRMSE